MRGRHADAPAVLRRRQGPRWAALGIALGVVASIALSAGSASAAATVDAQLAFTGVVTGNSPTGGSVVGVHPGDTVNFRAATVPTQGLDKLGLGSLANQLGGL